MRTFTEPKDRILVALDVSTAVEARRLVKQLIGYVGGFKVGLELITAIGAPDAIRCVQAFGESCFFDGKFCDIPNTVGAASRAVAGQDVWAFNLHASCGKKAVREAMDNCGRSLVLGVTVLTSLGDECQSIFGQPAAEKVLQFAGMLNGEGAHGIICSAQEIKLIRDNPAFDEMILVTPGIRPIGADQNDQARIMTPKAAIEAGGDYLVIGRPITQASEPAEAAKLIAREIEEARTFTRAGT